MRKKMVMGCQAWDLARHHRAEPGGDFTSVCALDEAVQEQYRAVHSAIRMLAGWKWCRKK